MPNKEDIRWFKQTFQSEIEEAVKGTPFSVDMLTAIACQETGFIWQRLRRSEPKLSREKILELCVGDVLDSKPGGKGRQAFPRNKNELLKAANGKQMFDVARQALIDMAEHIQDYRPFAKQDHKFCHGFGIFQFDIQHFPENQDYFLQKRYTDFGVCLARCVDELRGAMKGIGLHKKPALTDREMAYVAITYNIGAKNFRLNRDLNQGHKPNGGRHYGQEIFDFLRLSKTVTLNGQPAPVPAPNPGTAAIPPPTPVEANGPAYEVDVRQTPLNLRSEPVIDQNGANVIATLPDGQIVKAVTNKPVNKFLEVETSLSGAHLRGFAFAKFLKPAGAAADVTVVVPAATPPTSGIVAVINPRKPGTVTTRRQEAGGHSLNEEGQPGRKGTTPAELCNELIAIVDWLAVEKPAHLRYKPQPKATFCNVYAHDYCHLAGVYLPRVWWTPGSIEKLAQGKQVVPKLENTIDEVRANALFRWLRDFGDRFGWRQTGSLTKLQQEVNQGAVGIIVARNNKDGVSGHIAAVVPEFGDKTARRNANGDVIAPLQSQAGRHNFRYDTGMVNWFKASHLAEFSFWLHA